MVYNSGNLYALKALLDKIKKLHFSVQTQYKFLKIARVTQGEIDIFEQQKQSLVESYAEFDKDGKLIISDNGGIKIKEECLQECIDKINEINALQVTFPDIYFSLGELEPLGLTLEELELLEPFIKD